jgi:hypothetical protein
MSVSDLYGPLILLAALVIATTSHGQSSGERCCGEGYYWTLYTLVRYPEQTVRDPDGFLQQELSSHKTLEACIAEFCNPNRYHQAPVESGRCIYVINDEKHRPVKLHPKESC